jgi:hypothetical protein
VAMLSLLPPAVAQLLVKDGRVCYLFRVEQGYRGVLVEQGYGGVGERGRGYGLGALTRVRLPSSTVLCPQVLTNGLTNALKLTREGCVCMQVVAATAGASSHAPSTHPCQAVPPTSLRARGKAELAATTKGRGCNHGPSFPLPPGMPRCFLVFNQVSLTVVSGVGRCLLFQVQDTGPGLGDKHYHQARICGPAFACSRALARLR